MKKKIEKQPADIWNIVGLIARIILGSVFIFSGLEKAARSPEEFAAVITTYQVFSAQESLSLARIIPWTELIFGLFVLAGNFTRFSSFGLGTLILGFIGMLISAIRAGINLENCGCFGQLIHLTPWQALAVDSILLALAFTVFLHGRKFLSVDKWVKLGAR